MPTRMKILQTGHGEENVTLFDTNTTTLHQIGDKDGLFVDCDIVYSQKDLVIPFPAGITLDLQALPIYGVPTDVASLYNMVIFQIEGKDDQSDLTASIQDATPITQLKLPVGKFNGGCSINSGRQNVDLWLSIAGFSARFIVIEPITAQTTIDLIMGFKVD